MSIARELYLEGIPSVALEAELLHRAIHRREKVIYDFHKAIKILEAKQERGRAALKKLNALANDAMGISNEP